jgi:leucyl aminopeptidase
MTPGESSVVLEVHEAVPDDVGMVVRLVTSPVEEAPGAAGLDVDREALRRLGFTGALATAVALAPATGQHSPALLVGAGPAGDLDAETLRRAGAAAAREASHVRSVAIDLRVLVPAAGGGGGAHLDPADVAAAVGEGALLASYHYDRYRSAPKDSGPDRVVLAVADAGACEHGAARARVLADAVFLARDLVNTPAGDLPPRRFAEIARDLAGREGLELRELDEDAIVAERLGGLLAVARGSAEPPRLLRLEYVPGDVAVAGEAGSGATAGDVPLVALVGKGITFDSGGLSLKTGTGMMTMKTDMSGAAAVLATLVACRRLGVGVRVVGFMPLTENMPGGRATKPGDVLRARNGKTIEVLNTDAEGRLVLADALSLAVEESPDAVVDLATLTGACVVALGTSIAGLMGNDDRLVAAVRDASARAGEPTWHLPLPAGYRGQIDSEIADMKNIGVPGEAGALTAGLLLEEFVGTTPWVHLDIAGPARSAEDKGYRRKGGTGFGVRTLLELLRRYEPVGGTVVGTPTGTEVLR